MHKRAKQSIINNPPGRGGVIVDTQFAKATYSDIAFAITTRVDSNGEYYVIVDIMNEETKIILEPINATKDGLSSTLTTGHDRARNITEPNGGHKQMGVLESQIMVLGWSRDKNGNVDNYQNVDVANCQTSGKRANTQNYVMYRGKQINDGEGLYLHDSERFAKGGNEVSRTLKSEKHDAGVCIKRRIRKLTERECFRLMGVNDKDIDTIRDARISKTKQYKMAGNSIVVDVLDAIFSNLFFPEMAEKPRQLTLF